MPLLRSTTTQALTPPSNHFWVPRTNHGHPLTSDQLTVASYNIQCLGRGLEGVRKRRKLRELFHSIQPQPDLVLLQEVRLTLTECPERSDHINFLNGEVLWNESSSSAYGDSYSGGTAMILSLKITNNLCEHGVIVQGRVQYITYVSMRSLFEQECNI